MYKKVNERKCVSITFKDGITFLYQKKEILSKSTQISNDLKVISSISYL